MDFSSLNSHIQLTQLAKNPVDLTAPGVMTPQRIDQFLVQRLGFKLFFATERITSEVLDALLLLAEETHAMQKMAAMQAGETVNFITGYDSEQRAVLHTAMRDFFDKKSSSQPAREASQRAYAEIEKLREFVKETDSFTDLVQIGIGGSELGPKAMYLALSAFARKGKRVHFISNVDPDDAAQALRGVDLAKTLFVIVSKSGTTLETHTNEAFASNRLQRAGLDPKNHLVAVTGKGSPMDDPSKYRACFYIWDYVGGRYSATSMVGGVALGFALGVEPFMEFLRGASQMDKLVLGDDPMENLPLLAALLGIWNRNFLAHPTCAIIPYAAALSRFPAHLQQLDMESNGKRVDKLGRPVTYDTGPILWGEPGTNGQHSFYQLIHQGTTTVPLELIGFEASQYREDLVVQGSSSQEKLLANLFAQAIALATGQRSANPNREFPGNRPSRILLGRRLDPVQMGALLSFYEHKVAFQGMIWNINSFDQEGVQLGKVLASQCLDLFVQKRSGRPIDPSSFPLGATYLRHL